MFVSIGLDGKVNVGDVNDFNNVVVGKEWFGVEIDLSLGFKGYFGVLVIVKKKYDVKILILIGGWVEIGGYFDMDGSCIVDGGFYVMIINVDGFINYVGIEKFVILVVEMICKY